MKKTVGEIAEFIGAEIEGDPSIEITGLSDITQGKENCIIFAENDKWLEQAEQTGAAAVIISKDMTAKTKTVLKVDNPKFAFGILMNVYAPEEKFEPGIHKTAIIGENVDIAAGASIQPYAYIGDNVKIGKDSVIGFGSYIGNDSVIGAECKFYPNVTVYPRMIIKDRVILHAGVVIGSDGFGYVEMQGQRVKIPQIGIVIVEDDVEIGSNSTVDRATLGETIIGEGTKIDNLVQIAHNDVIGKNCIFCAQAGVSGSCTIGDSVIVAGQAGIADHVRVEDNVIIGAQAGVPPKKIIRGNQMVFGAPARSAKDTKRQMGAQARLPHFIEKIKKLEQELESIKDQLSAKK